MMILTMCGMESTVQFQEEKIENYAATETN